MKKILVSLFILLGFQSVLLYAQKELICENIGDFKEGMLPFLKDNKWGFADDKGNVVIEPKFAVFVQNYGDAPVFSEGYTVVMDTKTQLCGYIDKTGELKIPCKYFSAFPFSEGAAIVRNGNNMAIIDKDGNILAEKFIALSAYHSKFKCGLAAVLKEGAYGFIDKTGSVVINTDFGDIRDFSDGFAAVQKDYKWGFIDRTGRICIPLQFSNEPRQFNSGRSFVMGSNGSYGIIDTAGRIIVEPSYRQAFDFSEGVAVVSKMNDKYQESFFIISTDGKTIKEFPQTKNYKDKIVFHSGFIEGLAIASKDGQKGFIDAHGKAAINFQFRELKPFSCAMAYAEKIDEKTKNVTKGFINKKGELVFIIKAPQF